MLLRYFSDKTPIFKYLLLKLGCELVFANVQTNPSYSGHSVEIFVTPVSYLQRGQLYMFKASNV